MLKIFGLEMKKMQRNYIDIICFSVAFQANYNNEDAWKNVHVGLTSEGQNRLCRKETMDIWFVRVRKLKNSITICVFTVEIHLNRKMINPAPASITVQRK